MQTVLRKGTPDEPSQILETFWDANEAGRQRLILQILTGTKSREPAFEKSWPGIFQKRDGKERRGGSHKTNPSTKARDIRM